MQVLIPNNGVHYVDKLVQFLVHHGHILASSAIQVVINGYKRLGDSADMRISTGFLNTLLQLRSSRKGDK